MTKIFRFFQQTERPYISVQKDITAWEVTIFLNRNMMALQENGQNLLISTFQ